MSYRYHRYIITKPIIYVFNRKKLCIKFCCSNCWLCQFGEIFSTQFWLKRTNCWEDNYKYLICSLWSLHLGFLALDCNRQRLKLKLITVIGTFFMSFLFASDFSSKRSRLISLHFKQHVECHCYWLVAAISIKYGIWLTCSSWHLIDNWLTWSWKLAVMFVLGKSYLKFLIWNTKWSWLCFPNL